MTTISSRSCFNFLILMNFIPEILLRPFMVSLGSSRQPITTLSFSADPVHISLHLSGVVIHRRLWTEESTAKCDHAANSISIGKRSKNHKNTSVSECS